jgi:hypothetical protein
MLVCLRVGESQAGQSYGLDSPSIPPGVHFDTNKNAASTVSADGEVRHDSGGAPSMLENIRTIERPDRIIELRLRVCLLIYPILEDQRHSDKPYTRFCPVSHSTNGFGYLYHCGCVYLQFVILRIDS